MVQLRARRRLGRGNVQNQDREAADAQQGPHRSGSVRKVHGQMSKRKLEGGLEDAINMDVMMDNMTDVVGTLLLVLIIVQLKVNSTIDDIQSNLPRVNQEQFAEMNEK